MRDAKTGVHLVGAPKPPPPVEIRDQQTGEILLFPQAAIGALSRDVLNMIVTEVSRNVTQNIVNNICARLKDRCVFPKKARIDGEVINAGICGMSRAAHHCNDHDFTEAQPSKNGAAS